MHTAFPKVLAAAILFAACGGKPAAAPGADASNPQTPAAAKSYTLTYFTMPG